MSAGLTNLCQSVASGTKCWEFLVAVCSQMHITRNQELKTKKEAHLVEGCDTRYPKPLGKQDWERLVENLKKGPTPKQIEIMKESDKWSESIKKMMAKDLD